MSDFAVDDEYDPGCHYLVEKFRGTGAAGIVFAKQGAGDRWRWSCFLSPKNARELGKAMTQMAEEYEAELEKRWNVCRVDE